MDVYLFDVSSLASSYTGVFYVWLVGVHACVCVCVCNECIFAVYASQERCCFGKAT